VTDNTHYFSNGFQAILSLSSIVPNLYRAPRGARSAELFPTFYFRGYLPEIRNVEASTNFGDYGVIRHLPNSW
jgi:hypothetical protein